MELLTGLGLAVTAPSAHAQSWLGLAASNYAGTSNVYINPSSIADSRHKIYLNVVGADISFYNTYLELDLPRSPLSSEFRFSKTYFNEQLTGSPKFASVSAEVRLPSLMLSLSKGQGIAFTNRVRGFVQASNVSEHIARLARFGLAEAEPLGLTNQVLVDNRFNVSANSYHEFAFSYARTFSANPTHFFKGGLSLKYLVGLGAGYISNEGTQYRLYNADSVQVSTPHLSYGLTDYKLYGQPDFIMGSLYGKNRLGQGLGADIGVTYEWRPDHASYQYAMDGWKWTDPSQNKYRLRLGLALTDLGSIRYTSDRYVRQAVLANTRTVQVGQLDTLRFTTLKSVGPIMNKLVGLESQSTRFTSYLPSTLRLTADYRLRQHLFTSLLWTQNLLPATTIGSHSISSVALVPRIEFSRFELAVPFHLTNNYQKFQLGTMVRVGPLAVGSDNLGGLFGINSASGADLYFVLGLALHKQKHKDPDGDKVSSKLDMCPKVKGTWEFRGCPDRDNDHVPDEADECPDVAGLAQYKGCPDSDGDGIPDKFDTCPTLAGPKEQRGCPNPDAPDQDNDGIPDKEDDCPTTAGAVTNHGCPE